MLEGEVPPELTTRSNPSPQERHHVQMIEPVLPSMPPISAVEEISSSWHRCMADYHVDPQDPAEPNVVTQSELKASKEPVAHIIFHAREEIDRLYAIVRQQCYVVLFCNNTEITIHHSGDESHADYIKC